MFVFVCFFFAHMHIIMAMNNFVIFGIILTLVEKKKCTSVQLARKFEVSVKTIYRYVEQISAAGLPIFCTQGKNGGIEISPDFDLESNYLTAAEMQKIQSLLIGASATQDAIIKTALLKVNHTLAKLTQH